MITHGFQPDSSDFDRTGVATLLSGGQGLGIPNWALDVAGTVSQSVDSYHSRQGSRFAGTQTRVIGPLQDFEIGHIPNNQNVTLLVDWYSGTANISGASAQVTSTILSYRIAKFLESRPSGERWDVLFVGHSRGGVVNSQTAARLHKSSAAQDRLDYVEVVSLDATAVQNWGDWSTVSDVGYPDTLPDLVDRAITYDDGWSLNGTTKVKGLEVRDGLRIRPSSYRPVGPQLNSYVNETGPKGHLATTYNFTDIRFLSHINIHNWWIETNMSADVSEFLEAKDATAPEIVIEDIGSNNKEPRSRAYRLQLSQDVDDHANAFGEDATHLTPNQTTTGSIETSADHDWFQIHPKTAGNIQIDVVPLASSLEPYVRFHWGNRTLIQHDTGSGRGGASTIRYPSAEAGRPYFVDISGAAGSTGSYRITITQPDSLEVDPSTVIPPEAASGDDYPSSKQIAQQVAIDANGNATIDGNVHVATDEDWLRFTTQQDGNLVIEIDTPRSSLDTHLRLHNDSVLLAQHHSRIERSVTTGETFYLNIRPGSENGVDDIAPGEDATGRWTVRITQPPTLPGSSGTDSPVGPLVVWGNVPGTQISLDDNQEGNSRGFHSDPADVTWLQVNGRDGENGSTGNPLVMAGNMTVTITPHNDDFKPFVTVFRVNGGGIDTDSGEFDGQARVGFQVTEGETIIIAVASANGRSSGGFLVQVEQPDTLPDDDVNDFGEEPRDLDPQITDEGDGSFVARIETADDNDWYELPIAGQGYFTLEVIADNSTVIPLAELSYGNDDNFFASDDARDGTAKLTFLPESGRNKLYAKISSLDETQGRYQINIWRGQNPDDDFPDSGGVFLQRRPLAEHSQIFINGTLEHPGDSDNFHIRVEQPGPVAVQYIPITVGLDPFFHRTRHHSTGDERTNTTGQNGPGRAVEFSPDILTSPDNWLVLDVQAGSKNLVAAGDYVLHVWQPESVEDRHADTVGIEAWPIQLDGSGNGSFPGPRNPFPDAPSLNHAGDVDVFQARAVSDRPITFAINGQDTFITIYDASGRSIATDRGSGPDGDSQVTVEANRGDLFYIAVKAFNEIDTGNYTVTVSQPTDDHPDSRTGHEIDAVTTPSNSDLWDIGQGVTVTGHSDILSGLAIGNMFGGEAGGSGNGDAHNVLFTDDGPAGTVHWVEWTTPTAVTVKSIGLVAAHDRFGLGPARDANHRGFRKFTLFAKDATGSFIEVYSFTPGNPYGGGPDMAELWLLTNIPETTAQEWRAEFEQFGDVDPTAAGPRVIELDGFGEAVYQTIELDSDGFGEATGQIDDTLVGDRDVFPVHASERGQFTIDVATTDDRLDTILRIYDSRGNLLAIDDDGGDGRNSSVTFATSMDEEYTIDVGGYGDNSIGAYRVTAQLGELPGRIYVGSLDEFTEATIADKSWREAVVGTSASVKQVDGKAVLTARGNGADRPSISASLTSRATVSESIEFDFTARLGESNNEALVEVSDETNFIRLDLQPKSETEIELTIASNGYSEIDVTDPVTLQAGTEYHGRMEQRDGEIVVLLDSTTLARFVGPLHRGSYLRGLVQAEAMPIYDDFADGSIDGWIISQDGNGQGVEETGGSLILYATADSNSRTQGAKAIGDQSERRLIGAKWEQSYLDGARDAMNHYAQLGNGSDYIRLFSRSHGPRMELQLSGVYGNGTVASWDGRTGTIEIREEGANIEIYFGGELAHVIENQSIVEGTTFFAFANHFGDNADGYGDKRMAIDSVHLYYEPRFAELKLDNIAGEVQLPPDADLVGHDDFRDNNINFEKVHIAGAVEEREDALKSSLYRNGQPVQGYVTTAETPGGTNIRGFRVGFSRTADARTLSEEDLYTRLELTNGIDWIRIGRLEKTTYRIETNGAYGVDSVDVSVPAGQIPDGTFEVRERDGNIEVLHDGSIKFTLANQTVRTGSYFVFYTDGNPAGKTLSSFPDSFDAWISDLTLYVDPPVYDLRITPSLTPDSDTGASDTDHVINQLAFDFQWPAGPEGTSYQWNVGELLDDGTIEPGTWSEPQSETTAHAELDGASVHVLTVRPISPEGIVGEASSRGLVVDVEAPTVTNFMPTVVPTEPLELSSVTFYLSEPLDVGSVALADVKLMAGDEEITDDLTDIAVDASDVTVTFVSQTKPGVYTLLVGPDIADIAGNSLDQNGDGTPDQFSAAIRINTPPVAVDDIASTNEDTHVTVDVVINDTDADGVDGDFDSTTKITTPPKHGTVMLDFNTKISYTPNDNYFGTDTIGYTVRDRDGAVSNEGTVSLTINSVNDAPTGIRLDNTSVLENQPGAVVGTLSVDDVDTGDAHSFVLSDERFEIVAGTLRLKDDIFLDHEAMPSVEVSLTAIDAGEPPLNHTETFALSVNNVNEPPTGIGFSASSIDENSPADSLIGVLSPSDPDNGDTHTFTLTDDADGRFALAGNELRVADPTLLDFEAGASHLVTVQVRDAGGLTLSESLTLSVNDINEAPTAIDLLKSEIKENTPGAVFGVLSVTDADGGDLHTLTVDDGRFEIVDGVLQLKEGRSLSYDENSPLIGVPITAVDSGNLSFVQQVSITVLPHPFPWRNESEPLDTNNDGFVVAIDVLLIINYLNDDSPENVPVPPPATVVHFLDASGDNFVTAIDALLIINFLNRNGAQPEGEFVPWLAASNSTATASLADSTSVRSGSASPSSTDRLFGQLSSEREFLRPSPLAVDVSHDEELLYSLAEWWEVAWDDEQLAEWIE